MKVNKKEWRLLLLNGNIHFAVKAGSLKTAKNYILCHLPRKAVLSALKATCCYECLFDVYQAIDLLRFRTDKLKKYGDEYVMCLNL